MQAAMSLDTQRSCTVYLHTEGSRMRNVLLLVSEVDLDDVGPVLITSFILQTSSAKGATLIYSIVHVFFNDDCENF